MPEPTHMVVRYENGHVAMYLNDESPVGEVLTRGSVEHCNVVLRAALGRSCPCGCELRSMARGKRLRRVNLL